MWGIRKGRRDGASGGHVHVRNTLLSVRDGRVLRGLAKVLKVEHTFLFPCCTSVLFNVVDAAVCSNSESAQHFVTNHFDIAF